jgi:putative endonuclease
MSQPNSAKPDQWFVYLLLCDHKVIYTGIAKDPEQRLKQHQAGAPHGAKFTRRFSLLELVYQVKVGGRSQASQFEYLIKKMPVKSKRTIINTQPDLQQLADWLGKSTDTD